MGDLMRSGRFAPCACVGITACLLFWAHATAPRSYVTHCPFRRWQTCPTPRRVWLLLARIAGPTRCRVGAWGCNDVKERDDPHCAALDPSRYPVGRAAPWCAGRRARLVGRVLTAPRLTYGTLSTRPAWCPLPGGGAERPGGLAPAHHPLTGPAQFPKLSYTS